MTSQPASESNHSDNTMKNSIKYLPVIALAAVSCGRKEAAQRPNVLLIVADDLGMGDISIYGDAILSASFSTCINP